MKYIKKNKEISIFIFCILLSFTFMFFGTKSSPLFPINDWEDSNSFFTLGKGMIFGKIMYLDLFEQKGPFLYFVHFIAALINSKSFIGVYIIESLFFGIFLYYSYKLLNLFITKKLSLLSLSIMSFLIIYSYNFSHGDSAEEMCLPLLMISLYYLTNFVKNNIINNKIIFTNGLVAGFVLTIKYSMLGFWFGFMMMIFFILLFNKEYKKALNYCFIFLLSMLIPIIPWIIYFAANNGLMEFINTYFIFNITSYTNDLTILEKFIFLFKNFLINGNRNIFALLLTLLGFVYILSNKNITELKKLSIIICYILLVLGIYLGGVVFRYYYLITLPFMVFGFVCLEEIFNNIDIKNYYIILIILIVSLCFVLFKFGHNSYLLNIKKENLAQYKFAEIINKEKNPSLLNYGFLDGGFYLASDIIPDLKYFQQNNINYKKFPQIHDAQKNYMKEKKATFIVTKEREFGKKTKVDKSYKLISSISQWYQGQNCYYRLYKLASE